MAIGAGCWVSAQPGGTPQPTHSRTYFGFSVVELQYSEYRVLQRRCCTQYGTVRYPGDGDDTNERSARSRSRSIAQVVSDRNGRIPSKQHILL